MIFGIYNEFSEEQAETTIAAHPSTNVVDLGAGGDALSRPIRFHCHVQTTATSAGAATVQVILQTAAVADMTSAVTLYDSGAVAVATLVAGYKVTGKTGVPVGANCLQFLRVTYTIAVAALTAGKFDAFLSNDGDSNEF